MNRPIVPLIVAALLALPMAAVAQQSTPAKQAATTADASQTKAIDDKQRTDPNCLQHTGTRIAPRKDKQGRCALGPGRVYTNDDIARTGETNVADALRKLDPSIY